MITKGKIIVGGASVMVGPALGAAPLVARSRLPRLLFFSLILCLALSACTLLPKVKKVNPPEWIQGFWLGYYYLNDGPMAYYFTDYSFEIVEMVGDIKDHTYHPGEQYTELYSDSYEQSSSTQYVLHIVEHRVTKDWIFTRLSDTQLEEGGHVLTKF